MKVTVKKIADVHSQILQVRNMMEEKHPNVHTTIEVLLWDDNTTKVECRHATPDAKKLCIASHYNGELGYREQSLVAIGNSIMRHADGTRYYRESEKMLEFLKSKERKSHSSSVGGI